MKLKNASLSKLHEYQAEIESQNEITCERLNLFTRGSLRLLRSLELINHDLALIQGGKRIVFAVDFSEIYTYLWPEKTRLQTKQVTSTLLSSSNLEFTLLPGTIAELVRSLKRLSYDNRAARRKFEDLAQKPFVSAVLKYFDNPEHKPGSLLLGGLYQELRSGMNSLEALSGMLNRLQYLSQAKNLLPLDGFLQTGDSIGPDVDIFIKCESSLNLYRPGSKDTNNFIDAHNYALAWSLSEQHINRRDTLYYLVTSSPVPFYVFRNIKWDPQLPTKPKIPDISLVRHPIQVLYLSQILSWGKEGRRELNQTISSLRIVLQEFDRLAVYRKFLSDKVAPTTIVALPQSKRYLGAFLKFRSGYDRLFSNVREAMESDIIADQNVRRERRVSDWAVGGRVAGNLDDASNFVSTRVVFRLFDELTRVTLDTIGRYERSLEALPKELVLDVDIEGVLDPTHRLRVDVIETSDFACIEVNAFHEKTRQSYLAGDIYEDYYALWWRTGVTFTEFLDSARRFVANLPPGPHSRTSRKKLFTGVYFYCAGEPDPVVIPLQRVAEFNSDDFMEVVEGRTVRMIRLATEYGDLFYDFQPLRNVSQRAGIITHLDLAKSIAWLVHSTNIRRTSLLEWRRVITRCAKLMFSMRRQTASAKVHDKA